MNWQEYRANILNNWQYVVRIMFFSKTTLNKKTSIRQIQFHLTLLAAYDSNENLVLVRPTVPFWINKSEYLRNRIKSQKQFQTIQTAN